MSNAKLGTSADLKNSSVEERDPNTAQFLNCLRLAEGHLGGIINDYHNGNVSLPDLDHLQEYLNQHFLQRETPDIDPVVLRQNILDLKAGLTHVETSRSGTLHKLAQFWLDQAEKYAPAAKSEETDVGTKPDSKSPSSVIGKKTNFVLDVELARSLASEMEKLAPDSESKAAKEMLKLKDGFVGFAALMLYIDAEPADGQFSRKELAEVFEAAGIEVKPKDFIDAGQKGARDGKLFCDLGRKHGIIVFEAGDRLFDKAEKNIEQRQKQERELKLAEEAHAEKLYRDLDKLQRSLLLVASKYNLQDRHKEHGFLLEDLRAHIAVCGFKNVKDKYSIEKTRSIMESDHRKDPLRDALLQLQESDLIIISNRIVVTALGHQLAGKYQQTLSPQA